MIISPNASAATNPTTSALVGDFWTAGTMWAGMDGIPPQCPFCEQTQTPQELKHLFIFGTSLCSVAPKNTHFRGTECLYARACFPHCLSGYTCGLVEMDVTARYPHYNAKKHRAARTSEGQSAIYSSHNTKWLYLYPEKITEIGLFLQIDEKDFTTNFAISVDDWPAYYIPGAFFTFSPAAGTVFGHHSLNIPLWTKDKGVLNDIRWLKLTIEYGRALSRVEPGSHKINWSLKFRYGNRNFTAWTGNVNDHQAYRYTDDDRAEHQISSTVAEGSIRLDLSQNDIDDYLNTVKELSVTYAETLESNQKSKIREESTLISNTNFFLSSSLGQTTSLIDSSTKASSIRKTQSK